VDDWEVVGWVVIASLPASVATVALAAILALFLRNRVPKSAGTETAETAPPTSAEWKFSDSWAANLTGIIAVIAAIVGAFGDALNASISKVQAAEFAVTLGALVAVTALAPLVYATLSRTVNRKQRDAAKEDDFGQPRGTINGLLGAAFLTLVGTFGALTALEWVFVHKSGPTPAASPGTAPPVPSPAFVDREAPLLLRSLPIVAGLLVAAYAVRTLVTLIIWFRTPNRSGDDPQIAGSVSRKCCVGETSELRVNLL
jgi:hypothetical protein